MTKCRVAVRMATGDVFSDEEIDSLIDRVTDRARRAGKADPTASERQAITEAARQITREELMEQLTARKMKLASDVATQARRARLDAMPETLDEAEKLRAYDVGSETQGKFTSSSVDAEGRARTMGLWGSVERGLSAAPGLAERISDFWGRSEPGLQQKIAREMARLNGDGSVEPTGDEGALHAARVFAKALDDARIKQNDQGASIQKLDGYIGRQSHDRLKIAGGFWRELGEIARRAKGGDGLKLDWKTARLAAAKRAFREWRDFVRPRLDPKTFEGLEAADVAPGGDPRLDDAEALAAKGVIDDPHSLEERMLYRVWSDIVTGRHEQLSGMNDDGDFRPASGSVARTVSRSRVLHFVNPDAWSEYSARYGNASLLKTVMLQLERGGRNAALMERWGPSPDAARAGEIERLAQIARARGDVDAANALNGWRVKAGFDAINGRLNTPENLRLAMILRTIRSWEAVTKLGSIVLSKATDLPMTGHTFARAGAGFLAGYEGALRGITHLQGAEARRAADLLDVGARSFAGHLSGQFNPADGMMGWNAWSSRLMYKINGFEFVNEGVRRGAAEMLARHLGEEARHGWEGLQQGTRETFERFGISPDDWKDVRRGIEPATDGHRYFTLDHLDGLDLDPARKSELDLRLRVMIHNILDDTTSEPRMREQIGLLGSAGLKAGTIWGEAARSFGQFKGFLNAIQGRHLVPAAAGYAGYSPVALMSHLIVASALAGFLSMNAKLISRGQAPRSFIGDTPAETSKIWGAAFAQGAGAGLYGDYLFGQSNRNGLEFTLSSLGGPAVGDMEQVAQIVRQLAHGGAINENTGKSEVPAELMRLGAQNVPLVNTFYTRLALDYFVLWRLQEAVSPGYLARYQSRVENQEGGHFIVPPTAAQQ